MENIREEVSEKKFERREDGNYIMELSGVIQKPENDPNILDTNSNESSRFNYIFADISNTSDGIKCYVREKNGVLRTATLAESRMHTQLFPAEKAEELRQRKLTILWQI